MKIRHPFPSWFLIAILAATAPIHAALAWRWSQKHGFFGGIVYWLNSANQDAVLASGVIDFIVLSAILGVWLLSLMPKEQRRGIGFFCWCTLYLVWPSLGLMVFLIRQNNAAR